MSHCLGAFLFMWEPRCLDYICDKIVLGWWVYPFTTICMCRKRAVDEYSIPTVYEDLVALLSCFHGNRLETTLEIVHQFLVPLSTVNYHTTRPFLGLVRLLSINVEQSTDCSSVCTPVSYCVCVCVCVISETTFR